MTFLLILIILFYIVFGIVDVRFGFLCKKEQRKNKTIAQIYVGTKKIVWIFGTIFFLIGILEVLLLLFSFNIVPLYVFLVMCIAVQWGFATFLWNYFCYSAVFMNEEKIYFYHKRKKQEISLENIAEIKAALGNVAYTFFDENNNMYFPCADENNYIIRKLNLDSGEIKDIFILDIEGTTEDLTQENKEIKNNEFVEFKESGDENYISFYGYDGKYLYIYKGVNIGKLAEKSQEERLADYDNYLYIINIDGNIEDIITLNKTADNASANIVLDYKGGDERCMLVTTSRPDVAGIELSQEERDKIGAINKEAAKKRFSGDRVCVSAVLDKSQIGSGSIKLQQITPE